jgi:hypothetical protein
VSPTGIASPIEIDAIAIRTAEQLKSVLVDVDTWALMRRLPGVFFAAVLVLVCALTMTAAGAGSITRQVPGILSATWGTDNGVGCPNGQKGLDNFRSPSTGSSAARRFRPPISRLCAAMEPSRPLPAPCSSRRTSQTRLRPSI